MEGSDFQIREFRDADYDALAQVVLRSFPDHPLTPAEIRRFDEFNAQGGRVPHRLAAVLPESGQFVASGQIDQSPFNFHPQKISTRRNTG